MDSCHCGTLSVAAGRLFYHWQWCVPAGFLFTYARIPYTHDLNNTAMTDFEADGRVVRIKEPLTGYGIYTELNTNAIGDIAARHGIHEVYFADLEILSILGIFNHNKLYIYGK